MTYLMPLPLLAFVAGAAIAAQAGMNARLGAILKSALLASAVAFAGGLVYTLLVFALGSNTLPAQSAFKAVPVYLWFSGGLLSAFGIITFYWLIPRMGVGPMMAYALSGQLILAMLASHFGWFALPQVSLSASKLIGMAALILGMVLINKG